MRREMEEMENYKYKNWKSSKYMKPEVSGIPLIDTSVKGRVIMSANYKSYIYLCYLCFPFISVRS